MSMRRYCYLDVWERKGRRAYWGADFECFEAVKVFTKVMQRLYSDDITRIIPPIDASTTDLYNLKTDLGARPI
jgi:hypothetical protein